MSITKVNADVMDLSDAYAFTGDVSGAGKIIQVVSTQTGASSTTTTIMPRDDTIPQNTEGFEVMTLAITPTSSSNKLLIEVLTFTGFSADNNSCVALFQDSTAGALASANTGYAVSTILPTQNGHIRHYMTAGTTSETTFKVDSFKKKCLLEGLDDIALSLKKSDKIENFEKDLKVKKPWIFND